MSTMTDTKGRRTRRSFTDDSTTEAVRLVLDAGKTVASAARDLGLTESSRRHGVEAGPRRSDEGHNRPHDGGA